MAAVVSSAASQLAAYVAQLEQVDNALRLAPGDEELVTLRADLIELINTLSDLAKLEQGKPAVAPPEAFRVGDRVSALAGDGWHPAVVERVTEKGYDVAFQGTLLGEKDLVARLAIKAYARPDTSGFSVGQMVSAWFSGDRSFYKAKVHGVRADAIDVEYVGFEGVHALEPECVRADGGTAGARSGGGGGGGGGPSRAGGAAPRAEEDGLGGSTKRPFSIPASLELKPDDTPEVAERKKKKLKAINRQHQAAEKEEAINESRASWQQFVTKKKDFSKLTKNHHDPNFNPERDHQELKRQFRGSQPAMR